MRLRNAIKGNDSSNLTWEVFFNAERFKLDGFYLEIGKKIKLPMANGLVSIPIRDLEKRLDLNEISPVLLKAEDCDWTIDQAWIWPDPLSPTELEVTQKKEGDKDFLICNLKFSPRLTGVIKIQFDIYTVNTITFEIESKKVAFEKPIEVPEEHSLVIPLEQPTGRYLGIITNIIQGDCSIDITDSVSEFSISKESNIKPSRYWGKGNSDVPINTYRFRNSRPERVEKSNVKRSVLRAAVPDALGKLDLVLEKFSIRPLHENHTCIIRILLIEFSCENDELDELSKIEFLSDHSQFRLEADFLSPSREKEKPLLRFNGRTLSTEIRLSPSEFESLGIDVPHFVSITSSQRINPLKIEVNDFYDVAPDYSIDVKNHGQELELFFPEGPLCKESIIDKIEIESQKEGEKTTEWFCPKCGKSFQSYPVDGYFTSCETSDCDFGKPYKALEETNFHISEDRQSVFVNIGSNCSSIQISITHEDSNQSIRLEL